MGIFGDVSVWNLDKISPDDNPIFKDRLVLADDRPSSRNTYCDDLSASKFC